MLASAARLCAARAGTVAVRQDDVFCRLAVLGYTSDVEQALRAGEPVASAMRSGLAPLSVPRLSLG